MDVVIDFEDEYFFDWFYKTASPGVVFWWGVSVCPSFYTPYCVINPYMHILSVHTCMLSIHEYKNAYTQSHAYMHTLT